MVTCASQIEQCNQEQYIIEPVETEEEKNNFLFPEIVQDKIKQNSKNDCAIPNKVKSNFAVNLSEVDKNIEQLVHNVMHRDLEFPSSQVFSQNSATKSSMPDSDHETFQEKAEFFPVVGGVTLEVSYSCEVCLKSFPNRMSLERHVSTHSKTFKCELCELVFKQRRSLIKHKETSHSEDLPFKCGVCGLHFVCSSTHGKHLKKHSLNNFLQSCQSVSSSSSSVAILDKNPFNILDLDNLFKSDEKVEPEESLTDCFLKGKSLNREKILKYDCLVCGKKFAEKANLRAHKAIHEEKKYKCDVCCKMFNKTNNLQKHKIIHTGDRPYVCPVCGKDFADPSSAKRHQLTHTGIKPHLCEICGKHFSEMSLLNRHIRSHKGETPYLCDVCSQRFKQLSSLKAHLRRHQGIRPFQCGICKKEFTRALYLRQHLERIHSDDRPHKCKFCGKQYQTYEELENHQKSPLCSKNKTVAENINHIDDNEITYMDRSNFAVNLSEVDKNIEQSVHNVMHRDLVLPSSQVFSQNSATKSSMPDSDHETFQEKAEFFPVVGGVTLEVSYSCEVCLKSFPNRMSLERHVSTHSKTFKCELCELVFKQRRSLIKHKETSHSEDLPFKCGVCGLHFVCSSTHGKHLKKHSLNNFLQSCQSVSSSSSSVAILDKNQFNILDLDNFFKSDEKVEPEESLTDCFLKGKSLNREKILKYDCLVCGKKFAEKANLRAHKAIHEEKKYKCDVCCKMFNKTNNLQKHKIIHTGDRPYVCPVCGKDFADPSSAKRHQLTHTGIKPHLCEVCGKHFSEMSLLNRHIRSHKGETPYLCDVCSQRFKQLSSLKVHMRRHQGIRPFQCGICKKEFTRALYLRQHLERIHSDDRPHKCKFCGKQYQTYEELENHQKSPLCSKNKTVAENINHIDDNEITYMDREAKAFESNDKMRILNV